MTALSNCGQPENLAGAASSGNEKYGIFDSHAHYDDAQFDADREELLGRVLPEKGVCGILNMGADLKGCKDTVALTERYEYLYGAVGIHPECARELPDNWLNLLREWLKCEKIVAVGEIGLDYHWLEECPKERQKKVFSAQLELAEELSLPVIIHDREAHADTLEFLQRYRPSGVVHCFSGSVETAREILKLGMYIGLGGAVTSKMPGIPSRQPGKSHWNGCFWKQTPPIWPPCPSAANGTILPSSPMLRKKSARFVEFPQRLYCMQPQKIPGACLA